MSWETLWASGIVDVELVGEVLGGIYGDFVVHGVLAGTVVFRVLSGEIRASIVGALVELGAPKKLLKG